MKKSFLIISVLIIAAMFFSCSMDEKEPAQTSPETETAKETVASTEGRFVFDGVSLILPDGFGTVEQPAYTLAVPSDYPVHTDNITFTSGTDKIEDYTVETLKAQMEQMFDSVSDVSLEKAEIDGKEAAVYRLTVELNGVRMKETIWTLFFDGKSVSVTFVDVSGEFTSAFEESIASIRVG